MPARGDRITTAATSGTLVDTADVYGNGGRRRSSAAGWPAGRLTLQPQYSLLVREVEWEIVPAAIDAGLGLLPWSPLGGGWLSGKYQRGQRPSGTTRYGQLGIEQRDRHLAGGA
jgi:aryl-alcohol dehydrogenase-like predicted oxidoreductase